MKLITELTEAVESLVEVKDNKKSYYITGPMMQAEIVNRNGRRYPKNILESQVNKYQKLIEDRRSLGELNHPNGPQINPDRVSHYITELAWTGNDVYGKAKILDTTCGKIIKEFLDEGIKFGVSTRGMGSVKSVNGINEVQSDFNLVCVDVVMDPSGPECFVNGIMEGTEWIYDGLTDTWQQKAVEEIKEEIKTSKSLMIEQKFRLFEKYLQVLSK